MWIEIGKKIGWKGRSDNNFIKWRTGNPMHAIKKKIIYYEVSKITEIKISDVTIKDFNHQNKSTFKA